jgi:hypothetical protein
VFAPNPVFALNPKATTRIRANTRFAPTEQRPDLSGESFRHINQYPPNNISKKWKNHIGRNFTNVFGSAIITSISSAMKMNFSKPENISITIPLIGLWTKKIPPQENQLRAGTNEGNQPGRKMRPPFSSYRFRLNSFMVAICDLKKISEMSNKVGSMTLQSTRSLLRSSS